ncbi:MAG: hypothetical protein PVH88_16115 [Ignavibacteria bacterium]|jgi:hypothetical protein
MLKKLFADKILLTKVFLYLVAIHSFFVGMALIFFPSNLMVLFYFSAITEPFFKAQGGVFHLVMVVAYIIAAIDPVGNLKFIIFAIITKLIATVFLITYFLLHTSMVTVFLSGVGDFIMAVILYLLFDNMKKQIT